MQKYYYDYVHFYDSLNLDDVLIIDEATFKQAEKGNNYFNVNNFWEFGEFENIEKAKDYIIGELSFDLYCKLHDC